MPPRRSHRKSRAGCRRCKNRKIKCDEVHPRCGNCLKHGVVCDFETPELVEELANASASTNASESSPGSTSTPTTLAVPRTPSVRPSPTPSFSRPRVSSNPRAAGQVDRLVELRLMYQYTTSTSKTLLSNSAAGEDIWQRAVPEMAFAGHTYLADAILSIAALHLRSQTPDDRALVRASHAYAASTVADYLVSLNSGITEDNSEALFLTASLIALHAIASRIFIRDDAQGDQNDPARRYSLPLQWFHAFQGVKTVVASSWQWIRTSNTVKAVLDSQPSFRLDLDPLGSTSFFGFLLEDVEHELGAEDPRYARATNQAYSHAIAVLNWAHKSPNPTAALAFPATVTRRFLELLEARRPRALVTLACFFALLRRLDDVWWLHDVTRREVMGIVGLFKAGSEWFRHLEWPVRIALWDGDEIPAEVWGAEWDAEGEPEEGHVDTMVGHIELMAEMFGQAQHQSSDLFLGDLRIAPDSPD